MVAETEQTDLPRVERRRTLARAVGLRCHVLTGYLGCLFLTPGSLSRQWRQVSHGGERTGLGQSWRHRIPLPGCCFLGLLSVVMYISTRVVWTLHPQYSFVGLYPEIHCSFPYIGYHGWIRFIFRLFLYIHQSSVRMATFSPPLSLWRSKVVSLRRQHCQWRGWCSKD